MQSVKSIFFFSPRGLSFIAPPTLSVLYYTLLKKAAYVKRIISCLVYDDTQREYCNSETTTTSVASVTSVILAWATGEGSWGIWRRTDAVLLARTHALADTSYALIGRAGHGRRPCGIFTISQRDRGDYSLHFNTSLVSSYIKHKLLEMWNRSIAALWSCRVLMERIRDWCLMITVVPRYVLYPHFVLCR